MDKDSRVNISGGVIHAGTDDSFSGDKKKYYEIISHITPTYVLNEEDVAKKYIPLTEAMGDETSAVGFAVINDAKIVCIGAKGKLKPKNPSSEPVTTKTLFDTASLAKPVTAYATIRCLDALKNERGVHLDSPVDQFFPPLEGKENMTENSDFLCGSVKIRELLKKFSGKGITFRDLLRHSSGIKDIASNKKHEDHATFIDFSIEELNLADVNRSPSSQQTWRYSNAGYIVLECALEGLTNTPFPSIMQQYVFEPLKMENSTFSQSLQILDDPARQFVQGQKNDGSVIPHLMFPRAAGGMHTTPEDYGKFMQELMRVYDLPEKNSDPIKKIFEKQDIKKEDGEPCNYGLGIGIDGDGDNLCFWHNGETITCCSAMRIYPSRKQAAVVMANASRLGQFTNHILAAIGESYNWSGYTRIKPILLSELSKEQFSKYISEYQMPEEMANIKVQILEKDGELILQLPWPEPKSKPPKQMKLFQDEQKNLFVPALSLTVKYNETDKTIQFVFADRPHPPKPLIAKRVKSNEIEETEAEKREALREGFADKRIVAKAPTNDGEKIEESKNKRPNI